MLRLTEPDLVLWERFRKGALSDDEETAHPVLTRWARARALEARAPSSATALDRLTLHERKERVAPLLTGAEALLSAAAAELNRRGFALVLADDDGVVLASHGANLFSDSLLQAGLSEGARWHEAVRGTNGIGTALAEGTAVTVLGRAHYAEAAHELACYAAPIRDPSGRVLAVLDISGPREAADDLFGIVVQSLAANAESALRAHLAESGERVLVGQLAERRGARAPRLRPSAASPAHHPAFDALVGDDPALALTRRRASLFARTPLPILLRAETGAGKERLARAIHQASERACGPFVAVNCGAISESLLPSELFGFSPGAFTGASPKGSAGRIGAAEGGTLFLDEVAEMSPALQTALLRVLEDGTYTRVGEHTERRADFRLICATWRDLAELVREGRFRQDLFFRLQGALLTLPPLRERADVPLLVRHLLSEIAAEAGQEPPALADDALAALAARSWPGNVRELRSALQYALVLADGASRIEVDHLPAPPLDDLSGAPQTPPHLAGLGGRAAAEAEALRKALERAQGNRTRAARELGVPRSTLYRMMARYGFDQDPAEG